MNRLTADFSSMAGANACIACGLCLPVCPTFRLTGDETASPRGRLSAIKAVAAGSIAVDQRFDEVTSFCLQCLACESACPALVPYGEIIESARAASVGQVLQRVAPFRRFVFNRVLRSPSLLAVISVLIGAAQRLRILRLLPRLGSVAAGLRPIPLPIRSARGGVWGPVDAPSATLFVGCVADPWFSDTHKASIELLLAAGYRVDATKRQTCCGALAAHAGQADAARAAASANIDALDGADLVVVDVAGCGAHLKVYGKHGASGERLASKTRDITEVVAEAIADGDLPTLEPSGITVAVQDPCHLEHGQRIVNQPRSILTAAGFTVVDVDRDGLCCGAAGLYQLDHPETGAELGRLKAVSVSATGAQLVASANAGCEIQLRRFLGNGITVRHPVEFYHQAFTRRKAQAQEVEE